MRGIGEGRLEGKIGSLGERRKGKRWERLGGGMAG